jgi:hypothetical protein
MTKEGRVTISYRVDRDIYERFRRYGAANHRRSLTEVITVLALPELERWEQLQGLREALGKRLGAEHDQA